MLFLYDLSHPEVFLHADRAYDRMQAINELLSFLGGRIPFAVFLTREGTAQGVPGDYLVQGTLLYLGGTNSVILFQIVLFLASLAALYHLTQLLIGSIGVSFAVGLLYVHLPYGLMFPHMLWSEALFNPLILLSFWFVARTTLLPTTAINAALAGVFLALAALVRVVAIPWLIIVWATFFLCRIPIRKVCIYTFCFVVIFLAWPVNSLLTTGHFAMAGREIGPLNFFSYSIFVRVNTIIKSLPAVERQTAEAQYSDPGEYKNSLAAIGEYAHFAYHYPQYFIQAYLHDVVIFVAQSGIERLTIDFLEMTGQSRESIQDARHGWRERLMLHGPSAVFSLFFSKDETRDRHFTDWRIGDVGPVGLCLWRCFVHCTKGIDTMV